jgi:hypothetical protein
MSGKKSDPPKRAIWLLRHLGSGSRSEALTGDLVERFREGRSSGWFWKQAFIAIAVGALREIRRHWPQICYAIAVTVMIAFGFVGRVLDETVAILPWWSVLPWPWSMLVFDLSPLALLSLITLPVLGALLLINRTFRWVSLLRTWIINWTLLALGRYSLAAIMVPVHGATTNQPVTMPRVLGILLMFFTFLASAWLCCRSPRNAGEGVRTVNQ